MSLLQVREAAYRYRGHQALHPVSFEIGSGEIVAIAGANGAGKSTLLRLIARIIEPSEGLILLDGVPSDSVNAKEYARQLGYLAQDLDLDLAESARQVVVSGRAPFLGRFEWEGVEDYRAADRALAACDAAHLSDRPITEMSGGERKRVFLARALVGAPRLLLLDEPFAALDLAHVQAVSRTLQRSAADGAAVALVSHDLNWTLAIAQRVLVLSGGRLVFDGPSAALADAALLREFFGVDVEVLRSGGRSWIVPNMNTKIEGETKSEE